MYDWGIEGRRAKTGIFHNGTWWLVARVWIFKSVDTKLKQVKTLRERKCLRFRGQLIISPGTLRLNKRPKFTHNSKMNVLRIFVGQ